MNFLKFNKKKEVNFIKMFGLTPKNLRKRKEFFEKNDPLELLMPEKDIVKSAIMITKPYSDASRKIERETFVSQMCFLFQVTGQQMTQRLKVLKILK